ncbi:MAG: hypothetical protein RL308_836 [Bacteroidota bacterium]|jgi:glycosyltransferase involved in cell wall biosynthesis
MKINIASYGGRNWLLDLAKELDSHGHEVKFYSYLTTERAVKFGLKKECNSSYFVLALPFLFLFKISKFSNWSLYIFHFVFDYVTALISGPCDVFIGQSPMHIYSLEKARKKYGATIILERGTHHVVEQTLALSSNPALKGKKPFANFYTKRDIKGYNIADFVSIASDTVRQSFIKNGHNPDKIFVNPYGVSLSHFQPTKLNSGDAYDLIIVGQWSHRKGCDLLIEVCKKYNYTLLHIGNIQDMSFPEVENMKHIDSVDQSLLINYYSMAKVFVLPSREEGLALVQPQALVCGLPIVCSKFTGGRDLRQFINDPKWIIEMKEYTVEDLNNCIIEALQLADSQIGLRSYSEKLETKLGWEAYGDRYNSFLMEKCSK